MSSLWGILKQPDGIVTVPEIMGVSPSTQLYATGPAISYIRGRFGVGVQPYVSQERSGLEVGPISDSYRNVVAWDGRIDNYESLQDALEFNSQRPSESQMVLAAFRKWGVDTFSRITGDWSLALWSALDRSLYLVRDHAGTRTLYVHFDGQTTKWATHLDTLLEWSGSIPLSRTYIGCYMACAELRSLTPYQEVFSVPPGHYLALTPHGSFLRWHWSALEIERCVCASDRDYEERFLDLFRQAVNRRIGRSKTVLAELSGGMDSTSIVCVSDVLHREDPETMPSLDTVSYLDEAEDSLDERRYITATENFRGKTGVHLDMAISNRTFLPHNIGRGRYVTPGADSCTIMREEQFQRLVWSKGYRSLLSGIGGDELLGGVPDPMPELTQLLGSAELKRFLQRSFAWSMVDRTPMLWTICRSISSLKRLYQRSPQGILPDWLTVEQQETVHAELQARRILGRWGYTVQQLTNERTWWAVMETPPHLFPRLLIRPEYRYPYLDKDLVNFLLAIPREQLVQPKRRRFLMRRAMKKIVPHEVLERSLKAYQLRGTLETLRRIRPSIELLFRQSRLADDKCIDIDIFLRALRRTCEGDASQLRAVLRTITLELWLQSNDHSPADESSAKDSVLTAH